MGEGSYKALLDEVSLMGNPCTRLRDAVVVVFEGQFIITARLGQPWAEKTCRDENKCARVELGVGKGVRVEVCKSITPIMAAVSLASKRGIRIPSGAEWHCIHQPASIDLKIALQFRPFKIVARFFHGDEISEMLLKESGLELIKKEPGEFVWERV